MINDRDKFYKLIDNIVSKFTLFFIKELFVKTRFNNYGSMMYIFDEIQYLVKAKLYNSVKDIFLSIYMELFGDEIFLNNIKKCFDNV